MGAVQSPQGTVINLTTFTFRSTITSQPKMVVNESYVHLWAVRWHTSLANAFVAPVPFLAVTVDAN